MKKSSPKKTFFEKITKKIKSDGETEFRRDELSACAITSHISIETEIN